MRVPVTSCEYLGYMLSPRRLTWAPYKVQIIRLASTMKSQGYSILPRLCHVTSFIYGYSEITSAHDLTHKGTPWHFSDECHSILKHLKRFHHSSVLTHWNGHSNYSRDWCLWLCTQLLSFPLWSWWRLAPYCLPLPDLFCPEPIRCPWQRATRNNLKLSNDGDIYLEGSGLPIDSGHRSLEFAIFSMTKIHTSESSVGPSTSGFTW